MEQKKEVGQRAYSAAHFALELDGVDVTGIRSLEGGGVTAEVLSYQFGDDYAIWRQAGKPKYEDIKLSMNLGRAEGLYKWMAEFFDGYGEPDPEITTRGIGPVQMDALRKAVREASGQSCADRQVANAREAGALVK